MKTIARKQNPDYKTRRGVVAGWCGLSLDSSLLSSGLGPDNERRRALPTVKSLVSEWRGSASHDPESSQFLGYRSAPTSPFWIRTMAPVSLPFTQPLTIPSATCSDQARSDS